MQRVDEMTTPPVVGEIYLVPSIEDWATGPVPVLGPVHTDAEIAQWAGSGAAERHQHYDARFLLLSALPPPPGPRTDAERLLGTVVRMVFPREMAAPILRPFLCLRDQPPHPFETQPAEATERSWLPYLEDKYATAQAKCGRCPHRGFPLGGLPVGPDGGVTCPGHGLRWHVETGRLLRRIQPPIAVSIGFDVSIGWGAS